MIIFIQVAVILIALLVVSVALKQRTTHFGKAWKKILLVLMAIIMVIAVLFPNITNSIAKLVGVGRGADLLLYLTVLAFIIYVINTYLGQQDQRDTLYRLARKVAIIDANRRYSKQLAKKVLTGKK